MSWVGKIKTKTDGWGAKKKSHIDSAQTVGFAEQGPLCSVKLPKQSTRRFGDTVWFFWFTAVCVSALSIEKCDNL